jgi:hypothetical protein
VKELLSIDAGEPEAGSAPAIYYGVFFRDRNGVLQSAIDNFYRERTWPERFVEVHKACKVEGSKTDCFIATLSVPASCVQAP